MTRLLGSTWGGRLTLPPATYLALGDELTSIRCLAYVFDSQMLLADKFRKADY